MVTVFPEAEVDIPVPPAILSMSDEGTADPVSPSYVVVAGGAAEAAICIPFVSGVIVISLPAEIVKLPPPSGRIPLTVIIPPPPPPPAPS